MIRAVIFDMYESSFGKARGMSLYWRWWQSGTRSSKKSWNERPSGYLVFSGRNVPAVWAERRFSTACGTV